MEEQTASPISFREVSAFYGSVTFEGVFTVEGLFVIDIAPTLFEQLTIQIIFSQPSLSSMTLSESQYPIIIFVEVVT